MLGGGSLVGKEVEVVGFTWLSRTKGEGNAEGVAG
jgi:hypothetical protein